MAVLTKITSRTLADNSVTSAKIQADALAAADLAPNSVGASELADDAVDGAAIADNAIGIDHLSDASNVGDTYHKVPTFANDSARNSAIGSPANGMLVFNTAAGAVQQYNGNWSTIAPAPVVDSVSGFLNEDTDSTLTVFGSNFTTATAVKMFSVSAGGSQVGSNATVVFVSASIIKATFGGGSIPAAGTAIYIEVDNSGSVNRFLTAITVNQDPVIALSGNSGTNADTTDHLGTYGGQVAGGPQVYATKYLNTFDVIGGGNRPNDSSNFSGLNNDTIGHATTVGGNPYISGSPFGDGKSAIKFDGSNDKLTVPASADFNFGTGAFTIEMWFWFSGSGELWNSNSDARLFIESNKLKCVIAGYNGFFSSAVLKFFGWNHVAVVRENAGTEITAYINGSLWGARSVSGSATSGSSSATPVIGHTDSWFAGYLDEIRIVKGVAVYTGEFTVPTTRLSTTQSAGAAGSNIAAITGTATKLLIHSNLSSGLPSTTITDSSSVARTITKHGSIIGHSTLYNGIENRVVAPPIPFATSGKKTGSSGFWFDGTGDYLQTFNWTSLAGTGVFTIDFWLNFRRADTTGNFVPIMGQSQSGGFLNLNLKKQGDGSHTLYMYNGSPHDSGHVIDDGNWHHCVVSRNASNVLNFWVDGTRRQTFGSHTTNYNVTSNWAFGWDNTQNHKFKGHLDIIRISSGVDRMADATDQLYSSNGTTYTIPTKVYGAFKSKTIPTITLTGTTTPALAADEDIEYTSIDNTTKADGSRSFTDTDVGLTLTNLTGGDKSKATLTGTILSAAGTTHTNMPIKAQVRKTLGNAAYNNSTTVTFSGGTTTISLSPAMSVSGTGIATGATIASVDTSTTITLSAATTGGNTTNQSLVFLDPTRITHINGSDTLDNTDTMMSLTTGTPDAPILFNGRRYAGNDLDRDIEGFGFQPDLVWVKQRSGTEIHNLFDSLRGPGQMLDCATTAAQTSTLAPGAAGAQFAAFTKDGWQYKNGNGANRGTLNNQSSSHYYVSWGWKAGGPVKLSATQTSTASRFRLNGETTDRNANTYDVTGTGYAKGRGSGTTYYEASYNVPGGFAMIKTTNAGTAALQTFPSFVGAPNLIIGKVIAGTTNQWGVYHSGLPANGSHKRAIYLDLPDSSTTHTNVYGVVSSIGANSGRTWDAGDWDGINGSASDRRYIYYIWKAVAGVSAFGSYNGGAGAISCGFRPRWVMIKKTNASASASWNITDAFRGFTAASGTGNYLSADNAGLEDANSNYGVELTSTGFTPGTSATIGGSGHTYIYAAFA